VAKPVEISDDSMQQQRYRYIFDSAETAIMVIDAELKISLVNALFEAHTGYSRDDVEGKKSWTEFVVDEDLDRIKKYHSLRRIDPLAVPVGYEFKFKDNWGNIKNAFASVSMIPGTKMSITSLINVTDTKNSDADTGELTDDESTESISSKEIAMVLERNVKFIFTDARLTKLIEDISSKRQAMSVIAFFPRAFAERIIDAIEEVINKRRSIRFDSTLYMGGRNMEVQLQVVPIFKTRGNIEMLLITLNDITYIKRAKQSHMQELALEDVNLMRNEFMASMSHELRTPLNNIIGYTEMILDQIYGKINDKQSQQLVYIHSSGLILLELINDFLDLSLIEMDELNPVLESFTLDEAVADVISICDPMANSMRHRLKLNIEPGIRVWSDLMLVKQCLYNLVMNAIRFSPSGLNIIINVNIVDDMAILSVRDKGIIIHPDAGDLIFQPFYHINDVKSGDLGTTGLGLTITQKLVEMMDGRVWMESYGDEGSEFFFSLPINSPSES